MTGQRDAIPPIAPIPPILLVGCGRMGSALLAGWEADGANADGRGRHLMALPAYDQCIKASHVFNLLDARGVISVTERQSYILRVRELAKACGEAWLATEGGGKSK